MKNKKMRLIISVGVIFITIIIVSVILIKSRDSDKKDYKEVKNTSYLSENNYFGFDSQGNDISDFDLYFMKIKNDESNKVYSPLSIKYALKMLEEAAKEDTKDEITNVIKNFKYKKYKTSENIAFANGLFIKNGFKVKDSYIDTLNEKYGADIYFDDLNNPDVINSWISSKTHNLVNDFYSNNMPKYDFMLINSLAIDMDWVNQIQSEKDEYLINYKHEDYYFSIPELIINYHSLEFLNQNVNSVEFGAVINKYDIVNTIGENNIRSTVGKAYQEWLDEDPCSSADESPDVDTYLNKYIKEIDENYLDISSSTDFRFYVDEDIKVISKDLKEYNDTTLEYIGIMPKDISLNEYLSDLSANKIKEIINNLKDIRLENFKDDVITEVSGYLPMFSFDYKIDLKDDLNSLGINSIFDSRRANLNNMCYGAYIDKIDSKIKIDFSNDGIKAAQTSDLGGKGDISCNFHYNYEVPVEKIDLTFNKPFLFIIRDKETGEVWFTGSVYEPTIYENPSY